MPRSNHFDVVAPQQGLWLPIKSAPKSDMHWLVVAKIADSEPNKGAVLWWYRAMFWRGAWRTSRDYSGSVNPTHFFDPERIVAPSPASSPVPPEQQEPLGKLIIKAVDDAVMRVGASANCYDVPADANSGAEYVAARVRSVVTADCTRQAQRSPAATPAPVVEQEPERIKVCIRLGKEDWIGVAYANETADPSAIHEYVSASILSSRDTEVRKVLEGRLAYIESKDLHNGWSSNQSGPCCKACQLRDEHFTGRADALKALTGCRNPFQLPEVCQCHLPVRQAVKNGQIEILRQVLTLAKLQPGKEGEDVDK